MIGLRRDPLFFFGLAGRFAEAFGFFFMARIVLRSGAARTRIVA